MNSIQQVSVIGMKYVHKYSKLDPKGNPTQDLLEVECSRDEYESLSNTTPPERSGYKWVASVSRHRMNTESGDLEDGQYYEYPVRVVKLVGSNPVSFEMVNHPDGGLSVKDWKDISENDGLKEIWHVKEKL